MSEPTATVDFVERPMYRHLVGYIEANARLGIPSVTRNSALGKSVLLCGAGPTLDSPEATRAIEMATGHVWAANSALVWMLRRGHRVTHAITIDPMTRLDGRVWPAEAPDVDYLLASCCHPDLISGLRAQKRRIRLLHSYMGIPGEVAAYRKYWREGIVAGAGMTVAPRALELARWMGYRKITVIGVGSLALEGGLHVGDLDPEPGKCYMVGEFGGRRWRTTPEFLMQARLLTDMTFEWGSQRLAVHDPMIEAMRRLPIPELNRVARGAIPAHAAKPDHPSVTLKATQIVSDVFHIVTPEVAACSL